jgi:hypothetical protein
MRCCALCRFSRKPREARDARVARKHAVIERTGTRAASVEYTTSRSFLIQKFPLLLRFLRIPDRANRCRV